MFTLTVGMYC